MNRSLVKSAFIAVLLMLGGCSIGDKDKTLGEVVNERADFNVNGFLMAAVAQHRVVIVGDEGHGKGMDMRTIENYLRYWIDQIEAGQGGDSVPTHLVLVLEKDSSDVERALAYGNSLQLKDILSYGHFSSRIFSTASLDLYKCIGQIVKAVERINKNRDAADSVGFAVVGAEREIDISHWSHEQAENWYLTDRDSVVAANITHFLRAHPLYHALCYYGSAHLARELTDKVTESRSVKGYFFPHYLAEEFKGSKGVFTIRQFRPRSWGDFAGEIGRIGRPFGVIHSSLRGVIPKAYTEFSGNDASITLFDQDAPMWPLQDIKSSAIVSFLVNHLDEIMVTGNEYYTEYWASAITYLEMVSAVRPARVNLHDLAALKEAEDRWRAWHDSAKIDLVSDIQTTRFWTRLIDSLRVSNGLVARRYDFLIQKALGVDIPIDTSHGLPTPKERADSLAAYLTENRDSLIISNLRVIAEFGSESERRRAGEILSEISDSAGVTDFE